MDPAQYSMHDMKLKRLRRPNFSTAELETLVDILENYAELTVGKLAYQSSSKYGSPDGFQKAPGWTSKNGWEEVAVLLNNSECNASDRLERTGKEVREKWIDFKCRLKKRYRKISALGLNASTSSPNSGTSSGTDPHLTALDLKALKLLTNAQKKIRGGFSTSSKMYEAAPAATTTRPSGSSGRAGGQRTAAARLAPRRVPTSTSDQKDWQQALISASTSGKDSSLHIIPIYSNGLSNAPHSPQPSSLPNVNLIELITPSNHDTEDREESCSSANDYPENTMDGQLPTDFSEDNSTTGGYVGDGGGHVTSTTTEALLGVVAQKQDRVIDLMMELVSETGQRRAVEEEALGLLRHLVALQARRVELEEIKMGIRLTPGNGSDT